MKGIITKNISNDYIVNSNKIFFTCKPCGRLRKEKLVPLVGDIVEFDEKKKYILNIMKRKNELIRPAVANIDMAIIVTSVKEPNFDTILLDKQLTIISYNNIIPVIYFTKLDLLDDRELKDITTYIDYYQHIGYLVSTDPVDLVNLIQNKIVVFTGQSGAGKSTLLNKIDPSLKLKTNEISKALGRGKHTTRHNEIYETHNTFIVDTPGFSKIDFIDMTNMDIRDNMKEMFDNLELCKYADCMHLLEDGCHVKEILGKEIIESRYNNYKSFINR